MPKVAKLPPKAEQLAWCREARAQNIALLKEYQSGQKRKIRDRQDSTQYYIQILKGDITLLDDRITELERNA